MASRCPSGTSLSSHFGATADTQVTTPKRITSKQLKKRQKKREERERAAAYEAKHHCECMCDCGYDCDCECTCEDPDYNPPDHWYPSTNDLEYYESRVHDSPDPFEDPEDAFVMLRNSIEQEDEVRRATKHYYEHFAENQARELKQYQEWIHQGELRANFYDTKPACEIPLTKRD
jgi:hypothetical protein